MPQARQRRPRVVAGQVDRPFQPPPPLDDVPMLKPELRQRPGQPQAYVGPFPGLGGRVQVLGGRVRVLGGRVQRPGQRGAQIVVLSLQPVHDRELHQTAKLLLIRLLGDPGVVGRVPAAGLLQLTHLR